MAKEPETYTLDLLDVEQTPVAEGLERWRLRTSAGEMEAFFHRAGQAEAAVIWVGGAGGGVHGPAGGLYPRLAGQLAEAGIASLRLDYRHPNELLDCVLDVLVGIGQLETLGYTRIALVGHSFGGAVVITAGAVAENVTAVAAMSSQTYGADLVSELSPTPLLLLHGSSDTVLPDWCSRSLYQQAGEPKTMKLYPGCGHGLDECREEVDRDLREWLTAVLQPPAT